MIWGARVTHLILLAVGAERERLGEEEEYRLGGVPTGSNTCSIQWPALAQQQKRPVKAHTVQGKSRERWSSRYRWPRLSPRIPHANMLARISEWPCKRSAGLLLRVPRNSKSARQLIHKAGWCGVDFFWGGGRTGRTLPRSQRSPPPPETHDLLLVGKNTEQNRATHCGSRVFFTSGISVNRSTVDSSPASVHTVSAYAPSSPATQAWRGERGRTSAGVSAPAPRNLFVQDRQL